MSPERPILFSGPMVRAILDGTKTQTRRVVAKAMWDEGEDTEGRVQLSVRPGHGYDERLVRREFPPRWQVGDRLWVREAWTADINWSDDYGRPSSRWWHEVPRAFRGLKGCAYTHYREDGGRTAYSPDLDPDAAVPMQESSWQPREEDLDGIRWQPSIHMPRWASRITLEVTEVRVQRLRDISEEDAEDEGTAHWVAEQTTFYANARTGFAALWDSINAKRGHGWDANPWVWAITFQRLEAKP